MTATPDVDVVILTRDRVDTTMETIASVCDQRDVDARVWLIDQGSSHSTLERLRGRADGDDRVELVELGRNLGVPGGRNVGAARGRASVIVNIDNDAVFEGPVALRHVVDRMAAEPELGAMAFRILNFFTKAEESWSYPSSMRPLAHTEFRAARFVGCGHALRRRAFEEAGGFDARLFFCEEELDLALKLLGLGYEIVYDPRATVLHKVASEGRVRWGEERYYYQTRNALYIDFKHFRSLGRAAQLASGYVAKATFNGIPRQAFRGVADAVRMMRADSASGTLGDPLPDAARRYVERNEARYRGTTATRVRHEVLVRIHTTAR